MNIIGKSECTAAQMAAYLIAKNPNAKPWALDYAKLYLEEGEIEGVRGDGAWIQSCKETGNFKFIGGTAVTFDQNNFCGLGVTKKGMKGHSFENPRLGIRAQMQHLKGYATIAPLKNTCIDPRYKYVSKGCAPTFEQLAGKWAVPGYDTSKANSLQDAMGKKIGYGFDIINGINQMKNIKDTGGDKMVKIAIDAGHGANTPGKRCLKSIDPYQTREWWLNDRIADRLENLLSTYNCEVIRVDDTTGKKDIYLATRVATANNKKADAYISIHHNAGLGGRAGGGTVVYYYSSNSERAKQAQKLYNAVVGETKLVGNRSSKVIKNGFYVIKNTKMPAFLIENGFMDSPTDVPIILSAEHAEKTAQGILKFLVAEFGLNKNGNSVPNNKPVTPPVNNKPTTKFVKNGVNYSLVFDPTYYSNKHPDLKRAFGNNSTNLFNHFYTYGMKEGRQAISTFNVTAYKNRYADLQKAFGNDLPSYYKHYVQFGHKENRIGV